ncbi:hypothetical protein BC835DRAFT_1350071 [Cytidiella melzeri]|nr:hypothetical protein BC835DRAFT_1350071 [Cytidiella melzeri]
MAYSSVINIHAELIGTFIEIFIYGIYLAVFCKCLQVLRVKYTEGRPTVYRPGHLCPCLHCTYFLVPDVAYSLLVHTQHAIMDILCAINTFTTHADVPQYAITYYTIVRWDLDIIKSTAYVAMTIVSDGLIASVTPNFILAGFLALLIAADISLRAYAVYLFAATCPGDNALAGRVTNRVKWFYAVTLVVNLICTVLIALKIWRVQHEVDWYLPTISALRNGSSSKKSKRAGWFRMRGWMPGDRLILVVVESAQGRPRSRHRHSRRLEKAADAAQQDCISRLVLEQYTFQGYVCTWGW